MIHNERSRLRTGIASLIAVLTGIALLYFSQFVRDSHFERLLNDLGSIVIVSVAFVLVFDYWQKEAFFAELFGAAKASAQLAQSGLTGFFASFHDGVDWDEIFRRSTHLDIMFAYGATWRNTHLQRVERLLGQDKARVRAVLPSTQEAAVVAELALRFSLTNAELVHRIDDAVAFFRQLAQKFPGRVEVYAVRRSLSYSSYRFNNDALLVLYNHREGRNSVPTFVCQRGGGLYDFLRADFYGIVEAGLTSGLAYQIDLQGTDPSEH